MPTPPKNITEGYINNFKDLITNFYSAEDLKKTLTQIYFDYSRRLVKTPEDINRNTEEHLYQLSQLIGVFDTESN